jgi:hypothetical protein
MVFALNRWNPNYNRESTTSLLPAKLSSIYTKIPESQKQSGVSLETEKSSSQTDNKITQSELPITVDPLLAVGNPSQKLPKRHLGPHQYQLFLFDLNKFR